MNENDSASSHDQSCLLQEWPEGSRPQDPSWDGRWLRVAILDDDKSRRLPRRIRVNDVNDNTCIYEAAGMKIVEPGKRGLLSFSFHDRCGPYPDTMPQTVDVSDEANNTCTYVPVHPRQSATGYRCSCGSVCAAYRASKRKERLRLGQMG